MLLSSQTDVMRANHPTNEENDMQLSQEWDKTFPKSAKVDHQSAPRATSHASSCSRCESQNVAL